MPIEAKKAPAKSNRLSRGKARSTAKRGAKTAPARTARVKPIPDNYPQVGPYLRVGGAAAALDFYGKVFGARVRNRLDMPDGRVGHAELVIGKGLLMLSDEFPDKDILGPKAVGGASVAIHVYMRDVDAVMARAEKEGATVMRPAQDEFYGDRTGMIEDPFGHVWMVQTHIENVTPAQMKKRLKAMFETPAAD